jgi:hypothetical protein
MAQPAWENWNGGPNSTKSHTDSLQLHPKTPWIARSTATIVPFGIRGIPADHAYFFNIRVNFSKNHSAPSSMRAEREYVDTFRLDIGTMQRSPNGNCRFKCSESFSVVGGCHSQALSRNTGTDQIVRRHLGITLRVLIPAAGEGYASIGRDPVNPK